MQQGSLFRSGRTIPWSKANLGLGDLAKIYSPCRAERRDSETIRMAHVSAHVLYSAAECGDRIQSDAGAVAAFLITIHIGCLHAGNLASKARGASSGPRSCVRL